MAEYVTRQFADKDTGAPVIGGDFDLLDTLSIAAEPIIFVECTDPLYPGRYTSENEVPNGVWAVRRNAGTGFVPTGEEITVSPGRISVGPLGGSGGMTLLELVVGDVVHAAAFVPEGATSPTTAHLQAAINFAQDSGFKKVYVGAFKEQRTWAGGQVVITDPNMVIDLGGARLERTDAPGAVIDVTAEATGSGIWNGCWIRDGEIVGSGTSPYPEVNSAGCRMFFSNIRFPRSITYGPAIPIAATCQNGSGYVGAHYSNCINHVLWKQSDMGDTRFQTSDILCAEADAVTNGLTAWSPPASANVQDFHIGLMFSALLQEAWTAAPSDAVSPFNSADEVGNAIKHLFFVQNPKLNSLITRSPIRDLALHKQAGFASMTMIRTYNVPGGPYYSMEAVPAQVDVSDATTESGMLSIRECAEADTLYRSIEFAAFFALPRTAVAATPGSPTVYQPSYSHPAVLTLNTASARALFRELGSDSVDMDLATPALFAELEVEQEKFSTNKSLCSRKFIGKASFSGDSLVVDFTQDFYDELVAADLIDVATMTSIKQSWIVPDSNGSTTAGNQFYGKRRCRLRIFAINGSRTDLPRFK